MCACACVYVCVLYWTVLWCTCIQTYGSMLAIVLPLCVLTAAVFSASSFEVISNVKQYQKKKKIDAAFMKAAFMVAYTY